MKEVTEALFELRDEKYRDFHAGLIPTVDKERIIGVRTPVLRRYARELAKSDNVMDFLNELPHYYYEENNVHASIIAGMKGDITTVLRETERFLPYIDNWATCDMFSPKLFKKYPDLIYGKCMEWIRSSHTYTIRFGIVTLMNNYLDENYRPELLFEITAIHSEEYYVNMAIAWFFSYALIKQYGDTILLFEGRKIDRRVHNKSIQKAVESCRINGDTKQYLKSLKIK